MKQLLIFIFFTNLLFSQNINYAYLNNHSFNMVSGDLVFKASYLRVNNTLDIFNIRESELGTLSKYGASIGDMNGYEMAVNFGINKNNSIFFNYQNWNIDYGGSTLNNNKFHIFNRFNLISNIFSYWNTVSVDFGFIQDSANRVNITNVELMNSTLKKVSPNSEYIIGENGTILKDGTIVTLFDKHQNILTPNVSIDNLSSNSFYAKLLIGKRILRKSILNLYTSYYYVDITSKIDIPVEIMSGIDIPNLNRDEHVLSFGLSSTTEFKYLIFETNYEYSEIFRDSHLNYRDYNHNLDIAFVKPITPNFIVFISGKLLFQQLNREIPYLYNKYTETQFDKKYGFVKFGLTYKIKGL